MSELENPEVPVVTEMAGRVIESRMACRNSCWRKGWKGRKMRGRMREVRGYLIHHVKSGKEKAREAEVKTPEAAEDISPCNPILEHWHENRNGILWEMAEVQGYAGNVKSEKDRPGGESEVDFTRRKFAGTMSVIVRCVRHGKPENSDKPEGPIVPEVVSASLLEEFRGGSELMKDQGRDKPDMPDKPDEPGVPGKPDEPGVIAYLGYCIRSPRGRYVRGDKPNPPMLQNTLRKCWKHAADHAAVDL
ncbi:hypothetical protein K438DRAFT_1779099 [Mycena galopus ATCC 62051]|nr:hypothetical protein K438DRAFT_1779099 [Mycena galopus ATCC 62051]